MMQLLSVLLCVGNYNRIVCVCFAAHDQVQVYPVYVRQGSVQREGRQRENSRLVNHTCQLYCV